MGCRLLFAVCILRVCDDFALNFTNRFYLRILRATRHCLRA
ncbi:hypothetical protein CAMRE0001_2933 [Campylobacter rectus RM3267]|uniref:Uncharacterized protein n=1 Tax=Campylobacter rectus RM3267 TaxID=553218 RepID=B9D291_CAMRE|nr:hypothetical protein CAMRE0001_2933 [Campylobacter rectus RM3267]